MKQFIVVASLGAIFLSGCATKGPHEGLHRGSVIMKMSDGEAHVCLGNAEVALGDEVKLVRHDCQPRRVSGARGGGGVEMTCTPKVLGMGQVTKVYDSHYSVVKFPSDIPFKEGDMVEKPASSK